GERREFARLFLAMLHARAGQHALAVEEAAALADAKTLAAPADQMHHLAEVCGVAATAAGQDAALPKEKRDELVRRYGDRAMAFLARARKAADEKKSAEIVQELKRAREVDALRDREDFRRLLAP